MSNFVAALDTEIAELERQLSQHPAYVKLSELRRLRKLYAGASVGHRERVVASQKFFGGTGCERRSPSTGASNEILTAVRDYLAGRTDPTPTREIMNMLKDRGIEVRGAVPQNVVSSTLSKSPDIQANGRKGWILKEISASDDKPDSNTSEADSVNPDPEAHGLKAWPGGGT